MNWNFLIGAGVFLGIFAAAAVFSPTWAAPLTTAIPPSAINVKDFGAKGDGKTDDTDAIQAAVNASARLDPAQSLRVQHHRPPRRRRGLKFNPRPEIVFPAGTYRVTRPIVFERYATVRGLGEAVIEQTDPANVVFYFYVETRRADGPCLFSVENMIFRGGKTQLHFWTNNTGGARVLIDRCAFVDSGGYAVISRSYGKPGWSTSHYLSLSHKEKLAALRMGIYWSPYDVKWKDGRPEVTPKQADNLPRSNNSTVVSMSNCRFENCMGAAGLSADTSVIRDCTVSVNPQAQGAIFDLDDGEPKLYRINATASPAPGRHPYWIKGGGLIAVRDSSFAAQDGPGMDFIRVPKETRDFFGWDCIVIDDCRLHLGGETGSALVRLASEVQPNIISITRVTETSGKPVKAIVWENPASLKHLPDFIAAAKGPKYESSQLKDQFKIELDGNSANIDTEIPARMRPFLQTPVPAQAMKAINVAPLPWTFTDLANRFDQALDASEYGVDGDPKTDDTAAIQKLLDLAGEKKGCRVVFPARVYRISKPLRLPPSVLIRGAGQAAFEQTDPDQDLFVAERAEAIGFQNCVFESGRYGVNVSTDAATPARIAFDACWVADQVVGIRCMAGEGKTGEENHTDLLFQRGHLMARQVVVTNAARSQIDSSWIFNGYNLSADGPQGLIENRGGAMRIVGLLGVPLAYERGMILEDSRWIDNWGRLYVLDTRFGGESRGMCNVYHRADGGTVYIGGGLSRFYGPKVKKCILFLEKDPAWAVLRNISSVPEINHGPFSGSSRVMRTGGPVSRANVFASGVMAPLAP